VKTIGAVMIVVLVLLSGCFVDLERKQAAQYLTDQAREASKGISESSICAGKLVAAVAETVQAVQAGDGAAASRASEGISLNAGALAEGLRSANASVAEVAKTSAVVQEDVGTPLTGQRIASLDDAEEMRVRYRSGIASREAILPVLNSLSPVPLPGISVSGGGGVDVGSGLGYGGTGLGIVATLMTILQRRQSLKSKNEADKKSDEAQQEVDRLKVIVDHAENVLTDFRDRVQNGNTIDRDMFKRVLETTGPAMAAEHKLRQAKMILDEQVKG